jgi:hypothetical protein
MRALLVFSRPKVAGLIPAGRIPLHMGGASIFDRSGPDAVGLLADALVMLSIAPRGL